MPESPKVSVIVSTDFDPPVLDRNMRALADQTLAASDYEAVFIDSVHTFNWQPVFDDFMQAQGSGLNFRFFKIPKGGRAKANNFGLLHTSSDLVLFLVDDFIPAKTLVEAHLRFHQQNHDLHMVGIGGGFFPEHVREHEFCRWLEDSGELFGLSFTKGADNFPSSFFYAANTSIKREFLWQAGMFDEAYPFPAWDDYDMSVRLTANGMKSTYLPDAPATHYHLVTFADRRAQMRWAGLSAAIFERRHPGKHAWQEQCAVSPTSHRWRALMSKLKFRLTGQSHYDQERMRSIFAADFVQAYTQAKAGAST